MRRAQAPSLLRAATTVIRPKDVREPTDGDLVRRARAGDGRAKEALYRRHVTCIVALASRLLGSRDEADDVVQDTFVAAFSGLEGFRENASFRTWLAGIAVHKVHRRYRRRKLLALLGLHRSSHDAMLAARSRSTTTPEARDQLRRLDEVLLAIPDVDRAAWLLRYVEGYSLAETATLAKTSLTTAKRRVARAHEVIRLHVDIEEMNDE